MNARSVVDRILMNRAILAGADTDYSELRSDTEYFHEKRDARSIESRGNRVRRVSWIFDLVPFPTLPAICLLHPREDLSVSPSLFFSLSIFLSFLLTVHLTVRFLLLIPSCTSGTNKIIKVLAYNLETRGQARALGKKLFGVSRSVTLTVVCVPILFSSIRSTHVLTPRSPYP